MSPRVFRFGLVAVPRGSVAEWAALARRAEDLGFSTLLVPDGVGSHSSFTALGAAAAVTEQLRLGTFVTAVPLHTPGEIAQQTSGLDQLSDGRFELGLGAGRPDADAGARILGLPWGTPGERVRQVGTVIDTVERLLGEVEGWQPVQRPRPPIMIAGTGERLLRTGAERAEILAVHAGSESQLGEKLRVVREAAGARFDDLELSVNVFHVGDGPVTPWLRNFGIDPERTAGNQHVSVLTGDTRTAVDTLKRRRDEFGVSYVTINARALEQAVPVVEALAGT